MADVWSCADCGAPDAVLIVEDIYCDYGHYDALYLCNPCADKREGKPTMDEQCLEEDGNGRR